MANEFIIKNGAIIRPGGTLEIGDSTDTGFVFPETDGSVGQALVTDGAGNVDWQNVAGSPGGSDTQIQFNNAGGFAGDSGFTTDGNGSLTVTGDLTVDDLNFDGNTITGAGGTNEDIVLIPNGSGLVLATSGYDMSSGPGYSFATKDYVDSEISSNATTPAGSDTQIQFNNAGVFGADSGFTTDGSGNVDITGSLDVDNLSLDGNTLSSTDTDGDIVLSPDGTGAIDVSSSLISNVAAPVSDNDAATKKYVDDRASGLDPKESVRVATTANITPALTQVLDGVTVANGDRVLLKNQTSPQDNGIYVVDTAGAWTRSPDMDGTPANEVSGGNYTFVEAGDTHAGTGWVVVWDGVISLGTDPINWTQFSESTTLAPGGSNTAMQYNDNGDFGGDDNFTTDGSGNIDITGSLDVDDLTLDTQEISSSNAVGIVLTANSGKVILSPVASGGAVEISSATGEEPRIKSPDQSDVSGSPEGSLRVQPGDISVDGFSVLNLQGATNTGGIGGTVNVTGGTGTTTKGVVNIDGEDVSITADSDVTIHSIVYPDTDGTTGQALVTDGSGNLSFASVAGSPGGSNSEIQYNNGGAFGGDSGFTTDGSGNVSVVGSLTVDNLNVNGNTIISTDTDGDVVLDPNGTGLVVAVSGYDMSSGPNYAFATKEYVDNKSGAPQYARVVYNLDGTLNTVDNLSAGITATNATNTAANNITVEFTFSTSVSSSYPPSTVTFYGFDYDNNQYIMRQPAQTPNVVPGGTGGPTTPDAFGNFTKITLKLDRNETGATNGAGFPGFATHSWIRVGF